ncbi:MAG: hypothetical protein LBQ81_02165 [Zoogloeaceae bacterium]|jgi:hypothetical protein|nr:hypothetical protein [Zoogloeaceae bacterium]
MKVGLEGGQIADKGISVLNVSRCDDGRAQRQGSIYDTAIVDLRRKVGRFLRNRRRRPAALSEKPPYPESALPALLLTAGKDGIYLNPPYLNPSYLNPLRLRFQEAFAPLVDALDFLA